MKKFSKSKALEKLEEMIGSIEEVRTKPRYSPEFNKWYRDSQVGLEYIFGRESRHVNDFNEIEYSLLAYSTSTPDSRFDEAFLKGLNNAKAILESMIQEVEQYWEETSEKKSSNKEKISAQIESNKVFIVHGHDNGVKEQMARFVSKIGLDPIILHEQPSQGKTIVEKFEEYSDVPYAIILLTPDDIGSSIKKPDELKERARQNVLFEFGFFIGKLGRDRVCGVVKGDLEIPSDYSGVVYIPLDQSDAWKFLVIKELKAVGFAVDANEAL